MVKGRRMEGEIEEGERGSAKGQKKGGRRDGKEDGNREIGEDREKKE